MKKLLILFTMLIVATGSFACPICEKQQPGLLKGITHGKGPEDNWDYIIVSATIGIVLVTLFFAVKWIIAPGERNSNHIKRTILN